MDLQNFKLTGKKSQDIQILRQVGFLIDRGEVGVFPTDTLYGLVGKAFDKKAVAKIYRLKRRQSLKPFIVLIASIRDLGKFGAVLNHHAINLLGKVWPGKTSVILPCPDSELTYLHRGTNSLAFRLPDSKNLRSLIKQTGPLVAPSANLEGRAEAKTIEQARAYFGGRISFYVDGGLKDSLPSTLIKIENQKIIVLRKGAVNVDGIISQAM